MRTVPYSLELLLREKKRIPDYKVYAFNPLLDSYSKIINSYSTTTPLDITEYCSEIEWTMTELKFTLKDKTGNFNPDSGIYNNYLGDGCIIRLKEGDPRIPESEWVWTFTGAIRGQLGWIKNRAAKTLEAKCSVFSRENTLAMKRRKITTKEYTVGTDLGIMFHDIAMNMGLTEGEIKVPITFGRNFYHKTNQISQQAPWEALTTLLEVMMEVPFFDGEGRLSSYKKNLDRNIDLNIMGDTTLRDYEVVERTDDAINKVIVTFLDSNLDTVDGPYQNLGNAEITSGFFTNKEELKCYWSDDRKQRASGTALKVVKGINDNLLPVGTESYTEDDLFSGTITITISIWVPILATVMLLAYVAAAFIPDAWSGQFFGLTIPIGRTIQAMAMIGILTIMMSLGSAQYEIWGVPFDLAYLEKRTIAIVEGIQYYEENQLDIKNDFIGTHDWCDAIAATELCYQVSISKPRKLVLDDFLGLEIGDTIQLSDNRKFFILDMKKIVQRGKSIALELTGFKILTY